MLHQFQRATAVTATNGHSQHILPRLHYVRGTEQEAKDACKSHHSDDRLRPYQRGGYSWFNSHILEGYTMFEQFRNGYYFHSLGNMCSDGDVVRFEWRSYFIFT